MFFFSLILTYLLTFLKTDFVFLISVAILGAVNCRDEQQLQKLGFILFSIGLRNGLIKEFNI